jgi:methanol--5-hydroxybenzimidazolylcobamide Co-methyltransferase
VLRDLYMISDRRRSPEAYLLAFDNAWRIGKTMASYGSDRYMRAKEAALEGSRILLEGHGNKDIDLTRKQLETLYKIQRDLESLPDDGQDFTEMCLRKYSSEIPTFNPKNYDI